MKPGRKLDELIALKVMGMKKVDFNLDRGTWDALTNYSTDITAAWEVVEKLTEDSARGFQLHRIMHCPKLPEHPEGREQYYLAFFSLCDPQPAEYAPHAICLAALKAIGHEFNE